ncbi:MAG: transglycosylase SLT domain-containing protein [Giesbergeria sp.]|uniref:transglycosylase SLT domain-containing protein n=1 Tax=Giesbergeria sp. TaxID=2818473 RepID=UPI00260B7FC6|nr:transglycosylase SLT domain-containing protein [Giesbergeria sp.]MDD2610715.1 transglycosylase SLT domain-containing protein [Giesbergeria sp.]
MQILSLTCLAGALLLSGCAATLGSNPATTADADGSAWQNQSYSALNADKSLQPLTPAKAGNGKVAPLFTPADLWDRIRRGFAMPDLEHDLVQDREQWYANRPDYMQRMTERSSKYLFHIVEELERRGMPTELALLPYIESAFNPQAVSSAKAAGMWQFMPATGTYFDLKQNVFRDDRRDVLASTRAALDYLQKLHGMFGDWHLALAAYNWGEGSVGRAIAKNQKAGLGTRYTDLNMPAETRMYVPKLQAVKNIVANPDAFKTELPLIENHPYFQTVDIKRDIDVALVAKLAGVREADFRALNPSHNKPVILAAGTPQILLPWDNAKVFERNLEAHNQGQYASWTVWTVPQTMSVADAAQRAGMPESELRALNNIPPRMLIKAGSALMVPRSTTTREDVAEHVADNGHIALTPEIVTRRTVVRAKKRDTVLTLAQRYRVSPASVADWNDVKAKASFKPGQEVVLFLPVQLKTSVAAATSTKQDTSVAKKTPPPASTTQAKVVGKRAVMAKERPSASTSTTTAKKKEPVRKLAQADIPAKVRR